MGKSREWSEASTEGKRDYLSTGAEQEVFDKLAKEHPDWLSNVEKEFVARSNDARGRTTTHFAFYTPSPGLLREAWNEYRGWAKLARQLQASTERGNSWGMYCLVLAAVCGALTTTMSTWSHAFLRAATLAATLASAVGAFLVRRFFDSGEEADWSQARATAEEIKSECFRYAAGAYTDGEAANVFDLRTSELAKQAAAKSLVRVSDPVPDSGDKREPVVPITKDWYTTTRVRDQISYYRHARARIQSIVNRTWWISFGSFFAAVAFGALSAFFDPRFAGWIPAMTTVGLMTAAYGGFGRYKYLISNYAAMQVSLERILEQDMVYPMSLAEIVTKGEDLFQSEFRS
jgi:hypothetical protein